MKQVNEKFPVRASDVSMRTSSKNLNAPKFIRRQNTFRQRKKFNFLNPVAIVGVSPK